MPTRYVYGQKTGTYDSKGQEIIYNGPADQIPKPQTSSVASNATVAETAPSVTRYSESSPLNTQGNQFKSGGIYGNMYPMSADEQAKIREQERQRVQAQIDAINDLSQQELAGAAVRAQDRMGRNRAISANTGNLGNPDDTRRKTEIDVLNSQEQKAIFAEKAAKIGMILSGVEDRAASIIEKHKNEARQNADKFVAYLSQVAEQSRSDMQALAAAGADLSPSQRDRLIEQTGYDPDSFDALYKSMKISNSEEYINKNNPEIIGNDAVFFKQTRDPVTGKISLTTEKVALPPQAAVKEIKQIVARDDGMYVFYQDGTWDKVGEPKGMTATERKASQAATATAKAAVDRAAEARKLIGEIKSSGNINQITGAWEWRGGLTGANQDLVAKINRLKSILTIDSIKNFKGLGAMSDREFTTASSAATAISLNEKGNQVKMSQGGFVSELDRIDAAMKEIMTNQGELGAGGNPAGVSLQERADASGFDYAAMKEANYSDDEIEAALNKAGL